MRKQLTNLLATVVLNWNAKRLLRTMATPGCVVAADCSLTAKGENKMTKFKLITLVFTCALNLSWDPPRRIMRNYGQTLVFNIFTSYRFRAMYPFLQESRVSNGERILEFLFFISSLKGNIINKWLEKQLASDK